MVLWLVLMLMIAFKAFVGALLVLLVGYWYARSWRTIQPAHWGVIEVMSRRRPEFVIVFGRRFEGIVEEGLHFVPWLIAELREFSGELETQEVTGPVQTRTGQKMTVSGTFDFIRSRHVLTATGAARYPETHQEVEKGALGKRSHKLVDTALGYCTREDLWQRDEAVQLLISFVLFVDREHQPHIAFGWEDDEVVLRYNRSKKMYLRMLERLIKSSSSNSELEVNFAVKGLGHSLTFTASEDAAHVEGVLSAAESFRKAQAELERPDAGSTTPRMTPAESAAMVAALGAVKGVKRVQIEHIGGTPAGGNNSSLLEALLAAQAARESSEKKDKKKDGDDE